LEQARHHATGHTPRIFIIGGEMLYRQAYDRADLLNVTLVDADPVGDAWFPEFDWDEWVVTDQQKQAADAENEYACTFLTLKRKTPRP